MALIDDIIEQFTDWSQPWEFEQFVLEHCLVDEERYLFQCIWSDALNFDLWRDDHLLSGQKAKMFIGTKYALRPETINSIINAATYLWK